MLPKNFATLLRSAGLTVVEIDGWETRTRPGSFDPVGTLNHHTGSSMKNKSLAAEKSYATWMFKEGRSDLPAPLVQMAVGRTGVIYLGAAGRANHAGKAQASGSVAAGDGNNLYVGFEWMLSGTEPIPSEMYDAAVIANAVTLKVLGSSANAVSCHYSTSVTGKWDIGDPNGVPFKGTKVLDLGAFRDDVGKALTALKNVDKPGDHAAPKPTGRITIALVRRDLRLSKKYADRADKRLAKSKDPVLLKARVAINVASNAIRSAYLKTPTK